MSSRSRESDLPSADELPSRSVEPAPEAERTCMRCGQPDNAHWGRVTKDRHGWVMHAPCRRWTAIEADRWR
jgi:hypothetical protein